MKLIYRRSSNAGWRLSALLLFATAFLWVASSSLPAFAAEVDGGYESWSGNSGASPAFRIFVARTPKQWTRLWKIAGRPQPRILENSTEMAVGIFLGLRRTGGYGVEVLSTRPGPVFSEVHYFEKRPAKGAFVTQALTTPYIVQILDKSPRPVALFRNDGTVLTTEGEATWLEQLVMNILEERIQIRRQIDRCQEWARQEIDRIKRRCPNGGIQPTDD